MKGRWLLALCLSLAAAHAVAGAEPVPIWQDNLDRLVGAPATAPLVLEQGQASWYANRFHGRLTASGERYDKNALTAAHPTLPFLAQGAVMAIEDAYVLARLVTQRETLPEALAAYEAERKPRTSPWSWVPPRRRWTAGSGRGRANSSCSKCRAASSIARCRM